MNRVLIAVFIIVLVISLLFAPGKALVMGLSVPLVGVLIHLLRKASQWRTRAAERKARERQAPALARRRREALVENKKKAEEVVLKNAEADKNARQTGRVKALAEASRKDRKRTCLQYVDEHLLVECLIVDSNIWMNNEYDGFFYVLEEACREKNGYALALDAEQFEEIRRIGSSAEYGPERSHRARWALERIEQLQKKGLLTISSPALDPKPVPQGDSRVFQQIEAAANEDKAIALVTDDRDLRIRVRKYLYKTGNRKIEVVDIESVVHECREVQAADQISAGVVGS
jgi:hypothetical protein